MKGLLRGTVGDELLFAQFGRRMMRVTACSSVRLSFLGSDR